MTIHPQLTDMSGISEPTRRYLQQKQMIVRNHGLDSRFNSLCDAVAKRIVFMIDTNDAIGKIAELKKMIDSLGD